MTKKPSLSSREKGADNARRLSAWISATPMSRIPLNQFGLPARLSICRELGIPRSTIGQNAQLRALFQKLDASVQRKQHVIQKDARSSGNGNADLAAQYIQLKEQIDAQAQEIQLLHYLENTGVCLT